MLSHRSGSYHEASLQLPVYQGRNLPQLAPDTPAPQHGLPLELGTRLAAAPEKAPTEFEVTEADMLDALHAITAGDFMEEAGQPGGTLRQEHVDP